MADRVQWSSEQSMKDRDATKLWGRLAVVTSPSTGFLSSTCVFLHSDTLTVPHCRPDSFLVVLSHYCNSWPSMLCFPPSRSINFHSFSSVQFSCSVVSNSLRSHGLKHARLPYPSSTPELAQTHVHQTGDAIQPSHPLLSPFPPAFNLSQHQGFFQWVQSFGVRKKKIIEKFSDHPGLDHGPNSRSVKCGLWERVR